MHKCENNSKLDELVVKYTICVLNKCCYIILYMLHVTYYVDETKSLNDSHFDYCLKYQHRMRTRIISHNTYKGQFVVWLAILFKTRMYHTTILMNDESHHIYLI